MDDVRWATWLAPVILNPSAGVFVACNVGGRPLVYNLSLLDTCRMEPLTIEVGLMAFSLGSGMAAPLDPALQLAPGGQAG